MKSAQPFRGVPAPPRERLCRAAFAAHPLPSFAAWSDTALALWREACYREERYCALALLAHPDYALHARSMAALPLFEECIVSGAWWDMVDTVAPRVGALLLEHPSEMAPLLRGRGLLCVCFVSALRPVCPSALSMSEQGK